MSNYDINCCSVLLLSTRAQWACGWAKYACERDKMVRMKKVNIRGTGAFSAMLCIRLPWFSQGSIIGT